MLVRSGLADGGTNSLAVVAFLLESLICVRVTGSLDPRVTYRKTGMIENLARTLELPLLASPILQVLFFLLVSTEGSFHCAFFPLVKRVKFWTS